MQVAEACDENTIGVAAILGTTYSGHFEDVAGIDAAIGAHPPTPLSPQHVYLKHRRLRLAL